MRISLSEGSACVEDFAEFLRKKIPGSVVTIDKPLITDGLPPIINHIDGVQGPKLPQDNPVSALWREFLGD